MGFFTANNVLRMQVTTTGVDVTGSTDGVLNLDTTDQRGSFIRFKENGTTKVWAGCSEGIGTGGDQDDFGIRATGGFRLRTGANNSIEVNDEGQIKLRPLTAGFTTLGATNTYPGAAVSIQCTGVGAGTGTNIPQYGLYVDATASSNDATLMTGIYVRAKQNTENVLLVFMDYIIKIGILIVERLVDCSKRQQEQIDMLLNHLTLVGECLQIQPQLVRLMH